MRFTPLPHKNLFISGAIAVLIIAIGIFANRDHLSTPKTPLATQNIVLADATSTKGDFTERDSDQDGLPDWEEHLYAADPFKADTDGDGTEDYAEIKADRDPAKANTAKAGKVQNDLLPKLEDPNFATSSTDILGLKKEFFAKFLAEAGKEIRATTYRDLIKKFEPKKIIPTNQLIDLNISSDNSVEALHEYGNAFGLIMRKYRVRSHRTEEEILADAMKTKSNTAFQELQLPAISYKNFSLDLKALKVPSSLAKSHLLIVNGYEGMSLGLLAMQNLYSDPINGAGGYEGYTKYRFDVTEGYAEVVVILARNNVVFTPKESGYPLFLIHS